MSRELILAFLASIVIQGCASRSVMLVHPQSGSTIRCGEAGVGFMAAAVGGYVGDCLRHYEKLGYVDVEKLTPEQRADLERRGILSR